MGAKSAQNVKKNFCGSFQNFRKETRQITDIKGSPYLSGRYFSDSYRKIFGCYCQRNGSNFQNLFSKLVDFQRKSTEFYLFQAKNYFDYLKVIFKQKRACFVRFGERFYLLLEWVFLVFMFTRNISWKLFGVFIIVQTNLLNKDTSMS